jgi:acetyltransferase-like isoleucine patch superfamily enzyme
MTGKRPLTARILGALKAQQAKVRSALWLGWQRASGAKIGKGVKVFGRVVVVGRPANLTIGDGTTLNEGVILELRDTVRIGSGCHISSGTKIHTGYLTRDRDGMLVHEAKPIVIGDNVWLATSVVVGAGTNIASSVTVAANSVVLGPLSEPGLYAGAPSRKVR